MTPFVLSLAGMVISKGYPLTLLVIGHINAKPVFWLYVFGERTSAGLFPACSLPDCGLKFKCIMSPRDGM